MNHSNAVEFANKFQLFSTTTFTTTAPSVKVQPFTNQAAPQHVVLNEARGRLAVVHPAAQGRDELRRLDGARACG